MPMSQAQEAYMHIAHESKPIVL